MLDVWPEALENKEISAAIMLDMIAAFDVVDHDILIEKLKLYGVDPSSSEWIKSYLTSRSQKLYIDGAYSGVLDLEAGVPQGSVLGPLLYVIFTNDLPESVHDHLSESGAFFNTNCKSCGDMCFFADDSTFTTSGTNPEEIMKTIEVKYKAIKSYMTNNKLVLNTDKTHLLIMATPYQHRMYNNFGISLNTGTEIIEPVNSETLLGGHISNDFKFNIHLKDHDKSMFKGLTSRGNALSKVSRISSFKTRKMIADGIVMSKLLYLIQWWGGGSAYLLQYLQVLQNRAARMVTKLSWSTSTSKLLNQLGWLSVKQLVEFHSLTLLFKMISQAKPAYFHDKLNTEFPYPTRLATGNGLRRLETCQ